MTSTKWKLATALGVAGAIALSVPSAEARGGRNAAIFGGLAVGALALGAAAASQPRYYYDSGPYAYEPYAYQPTYYGAYDSYNYYEAPTVYYEAPTVYYGGRYRNRNTQIPGTNYNPNQ